MRMLGWSWMCFYGSGRWWNWNSGLEAWVDGSVIFGKVGQEGDGRKGIYGTMELGG